MRFGLALALLTIAAPVGGGAQPVLGIGDDAFMIPRGELRLTFGPRWTRYDRRFGQGTPFRSDGETEPIGIDFNRDTLGTRELESLVPLERTLRDLAGLADFRVTLGRLALDLDVNSMTFPFVAELGVSKRFSLGVTVPIVRNIVSAVLNVDSTFPGNIGFNPARGTTAAALEAARQNDLLFQQFAQAIAALNALVASCADPGNPDPRCPAVRAEGAMLAQRATQFSTTLIQVYLPTASVPFVPVAGRDADVAIRARIAQYAADFNRFGIPNLSSSGPVGARLTGVSGLQTIVTDSLFGLGADPLRTRTITGLGDLELAARLQLVNSLGDNRLAPKGLNFRSAITGVVRLDTGKPDSPDNFTDLDMGSGQTDIELRSQSDILMGSRFWMSLVGRFAFQLADDEIMRITSPDAPLAGRSRRQNVTRDLGDYYELEATPRLVLTDFFALSAQYFYRRKAADKYIGTFTITDGAGESVTLDAATLNLETEQVEHRLVGGFSYSTLAAVRKGKLRLPLEVFFQHAQSIRGAGGATPSITQDVIEVRVYTRLFGGK